jgi:hypoxanthine phosphoribosyltransferase
MQSHEAYLAEVLISEEELQDRIRELGAEISADYHEKDLHLICILRGGVIFLTDLMRQVSVPHSIDFMAVSSYGAGARKSSGQVRITLDLTASIRGRDVLLVEDIIDSGNTIAYVLELLKARHPMSLKVCTLLDKPKNRETEVPIHYRGFTLPDKFVFGYGLDIDEFYRDLPFIGVVRSDAFIPPNPE